MGSDRMLPLVFGAPNKPRFHWDANSRKLTLGLVQKSRAAQSEVNSLTQRGTKTRSGQSRFKRHEEYQVRGLDPAILGNESYLSSPGGIERREPALDNC
jgi:hypothetical protein